jgi:hypothetical protein
MKLRSMKLKNFGSFVNFECQFHDQVTHLVGVNGSGKTTVGLTAIWACMKGIADRNAGGQLPGERLHFIGGASKSSDIELTLVDDARDKAQIKIKNHITKDTNSISFEAPKGYPLDEGFLSRLLNVSLLSAKTFCRLSGREQALLLGIDVSDLDRQLKVLKEEATLLSRDRKAIGGVVGVEPAKTVDLKSLFAKREGIRQALNAQYLENRKVNQKLREEHATAQRIEEKAVEEFNSAQENQQKILEAANECLTELAELGYTGDEVRQWIDSLPKPKPQRTATRISEPKYIEPELPDDAPLREIEAEINAANETNRKAEAYAAYLEKKASAEDKDREIAENQKQQAAVAKQRLAKITTHKFPFSGLSVDDNGSLQLNGRPINENTYSRGELELIAARLYASLNPEFKLRFLDDFETLDEDNQKAIVDELLAKGFQVIVAEVGKASEKPNTILLRECKAVGSYEENEQPLL